MDTVLLQVHSVIVPCFRFHLGGEFSSFDSDTIVSCTSDSDELQKPNSEPLAKLKKLFDSPGNYT